MTARRIEAGTAATTKIGAVLAREPGPKDAPKPYHPYLETLRW
jgi:hypothetical protein